MKARNTRICVEPLAADTPCGRTDPRVKLARDMRETYLGGLHMASTRLSQSAEMFMVWLPAVSLLC